MDLTQITISSQVTSCTYEEESSNGRASERYYAMITIMGSGIGNSFRR